MSVSIKKYTNLLAATVPLAARCPLVIDVRHGNCIFSADSQFVLLDQEAIAEVRQVISELLREHKNRMFEARIAEVDWSLQGLPKAFKLIKDIETGSNNVRKAVQHVLIQNSKACITPASRASGFFASITQVLTLCRSRRRNDNIKIIKLS